MPQATESLQLEFRHCLGRDERGEVRAYLIQDGICKLGLRFSAGKRMIHVGPCDNRATTRLVTVIEVGNIDKHGIRYDLFVLHGQILLF